jgi:hypothetical protein
LVAILHDNDEKHDIAKEAIERIVWSLSRQLTVLAQTENDNVYYQKILKVLNVVYDGNENDFISSIRNKVNTALDKQ